MNYNEALRLAWKHDDQAGVAIYTGNLADLLLLCKDWPGAEQLTTQALDLALPIGHLNLIGFNHANLAQALHQQQRGGEALAHAAMGCKRVRLLHARNWDDTQFYQFFLVIDWMMALPPELDVKLSTFMRELEEEKRMEYVSSIERVRSEQKFHEGEQSGEQKGKTEMLSHLLTCLLTRRFGALPPTVEAQIKDAANAQIEAWFDRAVDAPTLDEVFQSFAH